MRHGIDRSTTLVTNSFTSDSRAVPHIEPSERQRSDGKISLAGLLPGCRFFAGDDIRFCSVAESADVATEGELVVYRIGKDCPSKLVADAMSRGAAGILTEQLLPCPLPQCIVGEIDLAMARITSERLGRPDRSLLTVGVIGSAGKTTTTLLVASLLRSCGIRTGYQSDLGECDGIVQSTPDTTVPSGAELVEWIGEANDSDCRASVIELSDDDARHGRYDSIEFDLLIVTGSTVGSDDYGPSALQCALERLSSDGVVIASVDDARAMRLIRDCGARLVTYGIRKSADVTVKVIDQSGGMTTLLVTHQDVTAVMETPLCGAAMAANHAAAIVVGLLIAQPIEEIVEKLGQLRSVPGRGQRLESFGHASVILDAGGSPQRVTEALRTFRSMKSGGRLWCVLATDGNDAAEHLAQYGSMLERFADQSIVTSTSDSKSSFLSTSHNVLDGVQECAQFRIVADRQRAIEWAISESKPNDTILFITGQRDQTANEQRSDIRRISHWIEAAREPSEEKVELKIFDGS